MKTLRKREGSTERRCEPKAVQGVVDYWTMGRNLERFHDTTGLKGKELYRFIAGIAKGVTAKGPDGKSAEEYAMAVHEFDPANKITKVYVSELKSL